MKPDKARYYVCFLRKNKKKKRKNILKKKKKNSLKNGEVPLGGPTFKF